MASYGRHDVSKQWKKSCLLVHVTNKEIINFLIDAILWSKPPVNGGFQWQKASNSESVSILWRRRASASTDRKRQFKVDVDFIPCPYRDSPVSFGLVLCQISKSLLFGSMKREWSAKRHGISFSGNSITIWWFSFDGLLVDVRFPRSVLSWFWR